MGLFRVVITSKNKNQKGGKSPDLKVNDKQLQTATLVYTSVFNDIILRVNASKYGILTIIGLTGLSFKVYSREITQKGSKG